MARRFARSPTKNRCVISVLVILSAGMVAAQQADWYPSRWGAEDVLGAANRLTEAKVLEAKNLMRSGQVYELARIYEPGMPLFGTRHFSLRVPYQTGPLGSNETTYHESVISGELGQVGTKFDGLGHIGIGDLYYNGRSRHDFATPEGLTSFGMEQVPPIVTRGVLIDVARFKGVERLDAGYEVTAADLRGALQSQGVDIGPGDVVLLHTGWGTLWQDPTQYMASWPGIGLEAAQFLVDQEIVMVGGDTQGTEVQPNPDPALAFPVHQLLLTKNGIYNLENLATEVLAADQVYEFAFFYAPLPLKGSPGSPGNPLAIR